ARVPYPVSFLRTPRLPTSPLFPYTTLFRSVYRSGETVQITALLRDGQGMAALDVPVTLVVERGDGVEYRRAVVPDQGLGAAVFRSEEHTAELQSLTNLVCRLLLAKKKCTPT